MGKISKRRNMFVMHVQCVVYGSVAGGEIVQWPTCRGWMAWTGETENQTTEPNGRKEVAQMKKTA